MKLKLNGTVPFKIKWDSPIYFEHKEDTKKMPSTPSHVAVVFGAAVWDAVVRPHLGKECPTRIVGDGSSQFVVSRDRILARTLSLYEDLYGYAIGSKHWPGDEEWQDAAGYPYCPGGDPNSWKGGVYFLEWIWHIIFGEDPILYPIRTG